MDQVCIDGLNFVKILACCESIYINLELLNVHLVQVLAECCGQLGCGERDLVRE